MHRQIIKGASLIVAGAMLMVTPFYLLTLPPLVSAAVIMSSIIPFFWGIGTLALLQKEREEAKKLARKAQLPEER